MSEVKSSEVRRGEAVLRERFSEGEDDGAVAMKESPWGRVERAGFGAGRSERGNKGLVLGAKLSVKEGSSFRGGGSKSGSKHVVSEVKFSVKRGSGFGVGASERGSEGVV